MFSPRLLFKNDKANHYSNKEGQQRRGITNGLLTPFPHVHTLRGGIQCELVWKGRVRRYHRKHASLPPFLSTLQAGLPTKLNSEPYVISTANTAQLQWHPAKKCSNSEHLQPFSLGSTITGRSVFQHMHAYLVLLNNRNAIRCLSFTAERKKKTP